MNQCHYHLPLFPPDLTTQYQDSLSPPGDRYTHSQNTILAEVSDSRNRDDTLSRSVPNPLSLALRIETLPSSVMTGSKPADASTVAPLAPGARYTPAQHQNIDFSQNVEACYNCGVYGHWAQFCQEPRRTIPAALQKQSRSAGKLLTSAKPTRPRRFRNDLVDLYPHHTGSDTNRPLLNPHITYGFNTDATYSTDPLPGALGWHVYPQNSLPTPTSPMSFEVPISRTSSVTTHYSPAPETCTHTARYPIKSLYQCPSLSYEQSERPDLIMNRAPLQIHGGCHGGVLPKVSDVEAVTLDDLLALDYPDNLNIDGLSISQTSKPLASTMEVADLEAPLPLAHADKMVIVSKYLQSDDMHTYNKNIRETPRGYLYCSDPAFLDIADCEESVPFEVLVSQRDNMMNSTTTTQRVSCNAGSRNANIDFVPVLTENARKVQEREEKLAKLGVTGSPKPVTFYRHPSLYVEAPTSAPAPGTSGLLRAKEVDNRLHRRDPSLILKSESFPTPVEQQPRSQHIIDQHCQPQPPSPPPINAQDHPKQIRSRWNRQSIRAGVESTHFDDENNIERTTRQQLPFMKLNRGQRRSLQQNSIVSDPPDGRKRSSPYPERRPSRRQRRAQQRQLAIRFNGSRQYESIPRSSKRGMTDMLHSHIHDQQATGFGSIIPNQGNNDGHEDDNDYERQHKSRSSIRVSHSPKYDVGSRKRKRE